MTYQTLLYERRGPVGLLTLNRPDVLNAIDATMIGELLATHPAVRGLETVAIPQPTANRTPIERTK